MRAQDAANAWVARHHNHRARRRLRAVPVDRGSDAVRARRRRRACVLVHLLRQWLIRRGLVRHVVARRRTAVWILVIHVRHRRRRHSRGRTHVCRERRRVGNALQWALYMHAGKVCRAAGPLVGRTQSARVFAAKLAPAAAAGRRGLGVFVARVVAPLTYGPVARVHKQLVVVQQGVAPLRRVCRQRPYRRRPRCLGLWRRPWRGWRNRRLDEHDRGGRRRRGPRHRRRIHGSLVRRGRRIHSSRQARAAGGGFGRCGAVVCCVGP